MPNAICRCGATALHVTDPQRCTGGHVLAGNQVARKHGIRAFEQRGESALPADLRVSVDDFKMQVIADRGGLDALTAIQRGCIVRLSEVETVSRLLASDLAQRGLFTPRGRVRSTLQRWLEVIDRWERLAQRIGMDRRNQVVTLSERLAAAAAVKTPDSASPDESQEDR